MRVRLDDQEMELRGFSNLQSEMATLKVIKTDLASRLATVGGHLEARFCLCYVHVARSSSARDSLPDTSSVLYAAFSMLVFCTRCIVGYIVCSVMPQCPKI